MTNVFIALDGNKVGSKLEMLLAAGDCEAISRFSRGLSSFITKLSNDLENMGCKIIMSGGDNILLQTNEIDSAIEMIDLSTQEIFDITFSIGSGSSPVKAYLALKLAKISGDRHVDFSETLGLVSEASKEKG